MSSINRIRNPSLDYPTDQLRAAACTSVVTTRFLSNSVLFNDQTSGCHQNSWTDTVGVNEIHISYWSARWWQGFEPLS